MKNFLNEVFEVQGNEIFCKETGKKEGSMEKVTLSEEEIIKSQAAFEQKMDFSYLYPITNIEGTSVWGVKGESPVSSLSLLEESSDIFKGIEDLLVYDSDYLLGFCMPTGSIGISSIALNNFLMAKSVLCHEMTHFRQVYTGECKLFVADGDTGTSYMSSDGLTYNKVVGNRTYPFREGEWDANDITSNGMQHVIKDLDGGFFLDFLVAGVGNAIRFKNLNKVLDRKRKKKSYAHKLYERWAYKNLLRDYYKSWMSDKDFDLMEEFYTEED